MKIETEKKFAAGLSICSNALIILVKFIAGLLSGSISIISEAIHSMSDFLASVLTFFAVLRASEPADKEHPFGHGRYEDVAGFIEGILIILASFYIMWEAFNKIVRVNSHEFNTNLGIIVMGIAIIANMLVSSYLFKVSKKSDSVALLADAKHLSTDVYSSVGVLIGLVAIKITGITILDPIIAICVALIILKAGVDITKETLNNIVDGTLPEEDLNQIKEILDRCQDIYGYKNIQTRKSGHNRDVNLTLLCKEDMSVKHCHSICDVIEEQIKTALPCTQITIHCEPFNEV